MSNHYVNRVKTLQLFVKDEKTGKIKPYPVAKYVLFFLADVSNDDGFSFWKTQSIAKTTQLGDSTVRKCLTFLETEKFIKKTKIKKQNAYQLLFKPVLQESKPLPRSGEKPNIPTKPLRENGENDSNRYHVADSPPPNSGDIYKEYETSFKPINTLNTPEDGASEFNDFFKVATHGVCVAMKVFSLPNIAEWKKQMKWAFDNKFSAKDFVDCYKLLRNREGRKFRVSPANVADNLPDLTILRIQKNKTTKSVLKEPSYFKSEAEETEIEITNARENIIASEQDKKVWSDILATIENQLDKYIFESWFSPIQIERVEENKIYLYASQINKDWVSTYYSDLLSKVCPNFEVQWRISDLEEAA